MRQQGHEAAGEDIDLAEAAITSGQGGHRVRTGGQPGNVLHPVCARRLKKDQEMICDVSIISTL